MPRRQTKLLWFPYEKLLTKAAVTSASSHFDTSAIPFVEADSSQVKYPEPSVSDPPRHESHDHKDSWQYDEDYAGRNNPRSLIR